MPRIGEKPPGRDGLWIKRSGGKTSIQSMTDAHLLNALHEIGSELETVDVMFNFIGLRGSENLTDVNKTRLESLSNLLLWQDVLRNKLSERLHRHRDRDWRSVERKSRELRAHRQIAKMLRGNVIRNRSRQNLGRLRSEMVELSRRLPWR